ncbi:MAG: tRNA 4-thiouridine(8) synthase ThiI [Deltaproteobacteria bacterium]|nr:tRNA 4-thiouridine(8) synthase ThiI [Deltaproteobacteria bacterium]
MSTTFSPNDPQAIPSYRYLLGHYGELTLRGKNRHRFESRLVELLSARLRPFGDHEVRRLPGRFFIEFAVEQPWNRLSETAKKVFGLSNAYGVWRVAPSLDAVHALLPSVLQGRTFGSFAVRCRRGEKQFPYSSQQVGEIIGRAVQERTGARVDLEHPEFTLWIEVMSRHLFVGADRVEGPRGLPLGMSGTVAVFLSGGIDSPVAAWRMMRRGCETVAFHFHSAPFTTAASQEKVLDLAQRLAAWHGPLRIGLIPFAPLQQQVVLHAPAELRIILYRRLMLRIAAELAREVGATALVTGDALGQVASQTLSNLSTIEAASPLPVLRPLVGMDKEEITATARQIGTYETSIEPHQDCCNFLEPRHPATSSRLATVERAEAALDLTALVRQGVAAVEWRVVEA